MGGGRGDEKNGKKIVCIGPEKTIFSCFANTIRVNKMFAEKSDKIVKIFKKTESSKLKQGQKYIDWVLQRGHFITLKQIID